MGLFSAEKNQVDQSGVDTIIGGKAKFKGELTSAGSVSINGEFEGKLIAKEDVLIARGSKVTGDVEGGNVIVAGKVNGSIVASQSLEIAKTGRVNGDLTGGKITIEEGSSYRGRVKVAADDEEVEETIIAEEFVEKETEAAQSPMF